MENFKFIVEENQIGMRLDKFLAEQFLAIKPEVTRSKIQHFIEILACLHYLIDELKTLLVVFF